MVYADLINLTDFLKRHTVGGMTFHQYTDKYVCSEIRPGQELRFGTFLLGDELPAKQIIGKKSGNDLICEQVQAVVSEWQRVSPRTWEQLLKALENHKQYNYLRMKIKDTLRNMELGTNL